MATVSLTQYSSYSFDSVRAVSRADGTAMITIGSVTIVMTGDEWRRVRDGIENGTTLEEFRCPQGRVGRVRWPSTRR